MTLNGGGLWTNIDGNLPDTPVNDIVVDPTPTNGVADSTLYVATDVGVFVTTTGGVSWSELATGLPHVECTSLKLNNTARVLRVGTHGRGDWDLQLPGLPPSALTGISPTSTTAGAAGFTLTLNGVGLPSNPTVNFGTTALSSSGSGSQITVAVPAAAVAGSGVVPVSVAGAQNSLNFSIEGPVPTLSTISPTTATASASITLTVTGTNFNSNSEVIWTPNSTGVNNGVSTALPQLPGGTSTSFSVTVPASLLTSSLARTIPVVPGAPTPKGPGAFWLLAAFCAAILGILMLAAIPRKRRLVFGATLTTVLVLLLIGGCGGVGSSSNPPPPPPGSSVNVAVNAYNPAPGGGLSTAAGTITVSQ
ncbi:MAG TPA: IPT/TIG domain-containing protein [Candidatus Dormibacteraeota bacterium]|nr:IPT/TIG domain-containing protein [Candidatus Dormibacteraeota bacterium]